MPEDLENRAKLMVTQYMEQSDEMVAKAASSDNNNNNSNARCMYCTCVYIYIYT